MYLLPLGERGIKHLRSCTLTQGLDFLLFLDLTTLSDYSEHRPLNHMNLRTDTGFQNMHERV